MSAIIWNYDDLIWYLRNIKWNLYRNLTFLFKNMHFKIPSAKWQLIFPNLNTVLIHPPCIIPPHVGTCKPCNPILSVIPPPWVTTHQTDSLLDYRCFTIRSTFPWGKPTTGLGTEPRLLLLGTWCMCLSLLPPEQKGHHFFLQIVSNAFLWMKSFQFWLIFNKFVHKGPIDHNPALV